MIDRVKRQHLALALRRLASGRMACDEFDDLVPMRSADAAVREIGNYGWSLYSDHDERLVGDLALSRDERRRVARCVLFLQSSEEYRWPPYPYWSLLDPLSLLSLGRLGIGAWRRQRWRDQVDWEVWPFVDQASHDTVASRWPVARAV